MNSRDEAMACLAEMANAVKDHPWSVLKICKHKHHRDSSTGIGSVTLYIDHKDNDDECWGCFAERMDDAFHMALQRIWALLAPVAAKNLDKLNSESAKEVSVTEMLVRAHMAWELAEEMLFAGDSGAFIRVLVGDEKEAARRAKVLDAPMRQLLETTGNRLKSSQDFTGKVGIIERYRELRKQIDEVLNKQAAQVKALNEVKDMDDIGDGSGTGD